MKLSNQFHSEMILIYKEAKTMGYNPTKFMQMVANEGSLSTAKKLINSKNLSDGFMNLRELGRLDLTVEALVIKEKYAELFTEEEIVIAKERLDDMGYDTMQYQDSLPKLISNGRDREFNYYSDEIKGQVIFEHLVNDRTHRWLDENILGRNGNTNGRDSANILYYMGMKADYRGIFKGKTIDELIKTLESYGNDYGVITSLLKEYQKSEFLFKAIKEDVENQEAENGNSFEGSKKTYLVNKYERNPKNRLKAIQIHGLNCFVCDFNFEEAYGENGKDFIEVHHVVPLSTLEEEIEIDPEKDMIPLCANCHRMIHRRRDEVLTIDELKSMTNITYFKK
ncbi:hypothetical protein GN156_05030 [bacterium LRH843]|nr:hypothetical protein [bacterium LRH843]